MAGGGLPEGPFGCILADPPWRFKTWSEKGRGRSPDGMSELQRRRYLRNLQRSSAPQHHYATMSLDDIKALPVGDVAARNCALFMWIVDSMLPEALEVGKAWGFAYKVTVFVWVKSREGFSPKPALGYWSRKQAELCLLFTKGAPKRLSPGVEQLIFCPRGAHSAKPDRTYEHVEALVGGPYLELFARSARPGWSAWGNEVGARDGSLFEGAA